MAQVKAAITALVLALVAAGIAAQSSSSGCTNVLISLSPCINYITGNSSTPSSSCCTQLASVVRSSPQCLCQVLNGGGSSLGINVNQTQALALPGACKVQTQPVSRCDGSSPAGPPAAAPESPNTVPADSGSKNVPSTDQGTSSAGSVPELSIPLLFSVLLTASYASTFSIY